MTEQRYDPSIRQVPLLEKGFYGAGAFGQAIVSIGALMFLVIYYQEVFGLSIVAVTIAMAVGKFADAISDPIMGMISDSTRSRFGRRKPYIAFGGCMWAITIYYTVKPPEAVLNPEWTLAGIRMIYVYIAGMMVLDTTFLTMFLVPFAALGVDITPNPGERVTMAALRPWCSAAGKMIATRLIKPAVKEGGDLATMYPKCIMYMAIFMSVLVLLAAFFCRERVHATKKSSSGDSSWKMIFGDSELTTYFVGLLSSLFGGISAFAYLKKVTASVAQQEEVSWIVEHSSLSGWIIIALTVTGVVGFASALVIVGDRKKVHGLANLKIAATNRPFICVTLAFIMSTLGLMTSSAMLPWLMKYVVGGKDAASDFTLVAFAMPLLTIPIWKKLSDKIGLKRTTLIMFGILGGTFAMSYWAIGPTASGEPWKLFEFSFTVPFIGKTIQHSENLLFGPVTLVWVVFIGIANGGMMMLLPSMLPDIVDLDTLRSGERRAGIFFSAETFAVKITGFPCQIIGAYLVTTTGILDLDADTLTEIQNHLFAQKALVDVSMETVDQFSRSVTNLRVMYMLLPSILSAVAFSIFSFYSLTPERVAENRRLLAERQAQED
ncbi:MFS transporter [Candidatus Hydrogenedentota bacterium]